MYENNILKLQQVLEISNQKYFKWYCNLIFSDKSSKKFSGAEKHHWMPKSLGGTDEGIVYLTPREHFIAHLLLWKMLKKESSQQKKMASAVSKMTRTSNTCVRKFTSYEYELSRKAAMESKKNLSTMYDGLTGKYIKANKKDPMVGITLHPCYLMFNKESQTKTWISKEDPVYKNFPEVWVSSSTQKFYDTLLKEYVNLEINSAEYQNNKSRYVHCKTGRKGISNKSENKTRLSYDIISKNIVRINVEDKEIGSRYLSFTLAVNLETKQRENIPTIWLKEKPEKYEHINKNKIDVFHRLFGKNVKINRAEFDETIHVKLNPGNFTANREILILPE